jgi:hypothetical protein
MTMQKLGNIVAATVIGRSGLFVSESFWTTTNSSSFFSQAEARYGVARRAYRRAAVAGAVVGGALAAGYGYGYGYGTGYPYYSYTIATRPAIPSTATGTAIRHTAMGMVIRPTPHTVTIVHGACDGGGGKRERI